MGEAARRKVTAQTMLTVAFDTSTDLAPLTWLDEAIDALRQRIIDGGYENVEVTKATPAGDAETVTVKHFRAVRGEGEEQGIAFDLSTREEAEHIARMRVQDFCDEHPQYHLEVWEQTYTVTPSVWRQVDG